MKYFAIITIWMIACIGAYLIFKPESKQQNTNKKNIVSKTQNSNQNETQQQTPNVTETQPEQQNTKTLSEEEKLKIKKSKERFTESEALSTDSEERDPIKKKEMQDYLDNNRLFQQIPIKQNGYTLDFKDVKNNKTILELQYPKSIKEAKQFYKYLLKKYKDSGESYKIVYKGK